MFWILDGWEYCPIAGWSQGCRADIWTPGGSECSPVGIPLPSRERLRGFVSGTHLDPVGPCGAPSCKDPGELRGQSWGLTCLFVNESKLSVKAQKWFNSKQIKEKFCPKKWPLSLFINIFAISFKCLKIMTECAALENMQKIKIKL